MQPSNPTKPVMDVAVPKNPAPAFNPFAKPAPAVPTPMSSAAQQPASVPVHAAPALMSAPRPVVTPAPMAINAHRPGAKKSSSPAQPARRTPVALITVTIFVMLVLSALAVTVYVTSQTA